jgi:hypothetical protein
MDSDEIAAHGSQGTAAGAEEGVLRAAEEITKVLSNVCGCCSTVPNTHAVICLETR